MPRRKLAEQKPCVVCNQLTTEFNYKVSSCNKCKMVFRRVMKFKTPFEQCTCGLRPESECRNCRFNSCITSGMQISCVQKYERGKIIEHLLMIDQKRTHTFSFYRLEEDLSFDQVMNNGVIREKGEGVVFTSHDWVLMEIYSTIEFVKSLDLIHILSPQDVMMLVKNAYFKCAIYFIAVRSFLKKLSIMAFPENVDVFPEEISNIPAYSPYLLNKVRSLLVSKFIEYKVTKEEILLVVSIIFCDPSTAGLSPIAMNITDQYRGIYCRALCNHCLLNHGHSEGITKFSNLLHLSQVLTTTIKDLDNVVTLFKMFQPTLPLRKLVKESF